MTPFTRCPPAWPAIPVRITPQCGAQTLKCPSEPPRELASGSVFQMPSEDRPCSPLHFEIYASAGIAAVAVAQHKKKLERLPLYQFHETQRIGGINSPNALGNTECSRSSHRRTKRGPSFCQMVLCPAQYQPDLVSRPVPQTDVNAFPCSGLQARPKCACLSRPRNSKIVSSLPLLTDGIPKPLPLLTEGAPKPPFCWVLRLSGETRASMLRVAGLAALLRALIQTHAETFSTKN